MTEDGRPETLWEVCEMSCESMTEGAVSPQYVQLRAAPAPPPENQIP